MDALEQNRKYREARKKAREIKGFYLHLTAYCIVIPILIAVNLTITPHFYWFPFSMIGWGIGLLFHGLEVFGRLPYFGKHWEQAKMAELIGEGLFGAEKPNETDKLKDVREAQRYEEAKKRVKAMSGFYKHLAVYLIINLFSIGSRYFRSGDGDPFFTFSTFSMAFFWGIGLALHAFNVFGVHMAFGKDWEERKIRKYMEKDQEKRQKWE